MPPLKLDKMCLVSLKMKSCFDKEGLKTLSHARCFEELIVMIVDSFECVTKITATTVSQVEEHDSAQSFKAASSNHNQINIEFLPKNEDCDKILKPLCEK